jgi:dTDP-4-dehydrorhamnose reductase
MKVLIVGSKGMLGTDLTKTFDTKDIELVSADSTEIDITDIDTTRRFIAKHNPDIVINAAAYTNVDDCETEIELAYKVNALGPRNIAVACNEINAAIVQISTDYVFDGETNINYKEDFYNYNPLSVYGKSKLDGEMYVKSISNKYYIVRTQWLYGKNGSNFVKTMVAIAKDKKELKVVNDQFGSPTYTKDLANAIYELIKNPIYGTYHITNSGGTTWYEFANYIFESCGINDINVIPCTSDEFPRQAQRPKHSRLENFNWKLNGQSQLRCYKEALQEYLIEENFKSMF